jgi:hypothetical protein
VPTRRARRGNPVTRMSVRPRTRSRSLRSSSVLRGVTRAATSRVVSALDVCTSSGWCVRCGHSSSTQMPRFVSRTQLRVLSRLVDRLIEMVEQRHQRDVGGRAPWHRRRGSPSGERPGSADRPVGARRRSGSPPPGPGCEHARHRHHGRARGGRRIRRARRAGPPELEGALPVDADRAIQDVDAGRRLTFRSVAAGCTRATTR